ncbi:hypothetical protein D1007_27828 [Hordeum vulgare]|nr:hypothetical protein D1007_27828 [Hordeum vulgare]
MVQGGLRTTSPGSVHGGGEAPGGQSSLRQGAGKSLLTLPISEALRRWNDGEICYSKKYARVSSRDSKYRPKEGTRGGGTHPYDLLVRPRAWPREKAAWEARAPLWPSFGDPEASVSLIFYIFLDFFGIRKIG